MHLSSANKEEPTLALKPIEVATRSPKTGVSVAPQKGHMSSKNQKKKFHNISKMLFHIRTRKHR